MAYALTPPVKVTDSLADVTGSLTRASGSNVGLYDIALGSGTKAANYAITFVTANQAFEVTARPITITADANQTKVYGETNPTYTYTVEANGTDRGLVGSDTFSGALVRAVGENAGSYPINLGSLANANYAITYLGANYSIQQASLSAVGRQNYNGTAYVSGASLTVTGVNNERFVVTGSAELSTKNVQTNAPLLNVNGLTLSGVAGALTTNYAPLSVANTQMTVDKLTVALEAPSITKVYDGGYTYNMTAADLLAMSSQLLSGDTITGANVVFAGNNPNAGTGKTVDLTAVTVNDGNNGGNYTIGMRSSTTSRITPAPLTITAANDAKFVVQNDNPRYAGLIINGFVNGETTAQLSGTPVITRTNGTVNAAGNYTGVLQPTGYASNNYAIAYIPGDYTIVSAQNLLVRVSPATVTYSNAPTYTYTAMYLAADNSTIVDLTPALNQTAGVLTINDGVGSSASFTLSPVNATLSGSNHTSAGAYNLTAANTQVTGANFRALTVAGSLTVEPLRLAAEDLGMAGVSKVYDGNNSITGINVSLASGSRIVSGDRVTISGTGTYDDANVGTSKAVLLNVALSGQDATNYALTSTQLSNNTGTITQLGSVSWVGPTSGGYWSNASNWAGGAIPSFSNVAQVVIPVGSDVIYDTALMGHIGSTIVANGSITFNGNSPFTFDNAVSGSGAINQAGVGELTLTGNNSHTGGININSSRLLLAHANALGTGSLTSNGGSLALLAGVTLPSLTVNGAVTISTDIITVGAQTYNGAVSLTGGNATEAGVVTPLNMTTNNANIVFASTLDADSNSYVNKRSLTITVGSGEVTFNGMVGSQYATYNDFINRSSDLSLYRLIVNAATLNLNADVTTFETQTYNTSVLVGDNGNNGLTRVLLSEDPAIIFNGTVDDTEANTHSLVVKAVSLTSNVVPEIEFNEAVGSIKALASLEVMTGTQNPDVTSVFSDTSSNPSEFNGKISIAANVTTIGNQTFTANTMMVGNASITDPLVTNEINMVSQQGSITYNLGRNNAQAGLIGVGTGAKLNAKFGKDGAVNGLDTGAVNPPLTYKVEAYYQPVVNERGAGFFTRLINRSVDHSMNNRDVDEVVEVGEVGLLEDGKVKRIGEEDPLCGTFGHDICKVK